MDLAGIGDAESVLASLASVFFQVSPDGPLTPRNRENPGPNLEARYRVLLDQIPAVVFHGVSGSEYWRSLCQSADRSHARIFAEANGWKIRFAGISRSIPTTRAAGATKPRRCSFPGSRCDRRIASWRAMDGWSGFIAKPGWSGVTTASPGSSTGWGLTSRNLSRRKRRCKRNATSFRRFSIPWARSLSCWTGKDGSCASIGPASR